MESANQTQLGRRTPMSKLVTERAPDSAAIRAARMAPPAGPDSTYRIGRRVAVSSVVMRPRAVIMRMGQVGERPEQLVP